MPSKLDLDLDGSDETPGTPDPSVESSTLSVAELTKRLRGQTKKVNELQSALNEANSQLEALPARYTEQMTLLRQKNGELASQLQTITGERDTLNMDKGKLAKQLDRRNAERATQKLIAEKHPVLLGDLMIGDLKLREDFDEGETGDTEYAAYLERQAKKVPVAQTATPDKSQDKSGGQGQQQETMRERLRGATPSLSGRVIDLKSAQGRTATQIADDMMMLAPDDSKYAEKYAALEKEMNEATSV